MNSLRTGTCPILHLGALALTVLALSRAAIAEPPSASYRTIRTPAGIEFAYRHDGSTPFAAVNFGLIDDFVSAHPGKEGFRSVAGRLVMQGARGIGASEMLERLEDLTATASIQFRTFTTSGVVNAPAERLGDALGLMSDALQRAEPADSILIRLRARAQTGEAQAAVRSETIAQRAALRLALGDHPVTRAFDARRFDRLDISDLSAWRASVLDRTRLRIVVSGAIAEREAASIVDRSFAPLPARLPALTVRWPPVDIEGRTVAIERETGQTAIVMIGLTSVAGGTETTLANVGNQVLGAEPGSRLFRSLRATLGATYGASSRLQRVDRSRRIVVLNASVANDKARASLEAMRATYARWRLGGLTAAELEATKSRMATSIATAMAQPSRANALLLGTLLNGRTVEEFAGHEQRVRALTLDEINRLILANFPPVDKLLAVVVAPSAEGLGADCRARSLDGIESCRR
jgi:predicted Zn-dependent peptidase